MRITVTEAYGFSGKYIARRQDNGTSTGVINFGAPFPRRASLALQALHE